VATFGGIAYVCFIVDADSRMIVGWRVASHMRTTMVLDAIKMARWSRGKRLAGLRCHSDAGSHFTSIRYGERLAEIGSVPSIGTVGDSFDNAMAETVNGYYNTELIRGSTRNRTLAHRRRRRASHRGMGPLAQHHPPKRLPRRHPPRIRRETLRYKRTDQPGSKSNSPSLH
jgi:transposase InsO family protein